jgi:hypothetical protein
MGPAKTVPDGRLVFWQEPALRRPRDFADKEEVLCGANRWVLKQAEVEVPVAELIRKTGVTEQTYYRWKAKYAGCGPRELRVD